MYKYDKHLKFGFHAGGNVLGYNNPPLFGPRESGEEGTYFILREGILFPVNIFFTYSRLEKSPVTKNYYIMNPQPLDVREFEISGVVVGHKIYFNGSRFIDFKSTDLDPSLQEESIDGKAVTFRLSARKDHVYATNIRLDTLKEGASPTDYQAQIHHWFGNGEGRIMSRDERFLDEYGYDMNLLDFQIESTGQDLQDRNVLFNCSYDSDGKLCATNVRLIE